MEFLLQNTHLLGLLDFLGYIDITHLFQYNDAVSSIKAALQKVVTALRAIGLIVAAIGVILAGYQFIWGGQNGSQAGKTILLNCLLGAGLILGASALIDWIEANITF